MKEIMHDKKNALGLNKTNKTEAPADTEVVRRDKEGDEEARS